jgi:hypothetical protein
MRQNSAPAPQEARVFADAQNVWRIAQHAPLDADNLTSSGVVDSRFVACQNAVGLMLMILQ